MMNLALPDERVLSGIFACFSKLSVKIALGLFHFYKLFGLT